MLLHWVLIRDLQGRLESQVLLCTNPSVSARQIVQWLILRWQLEVMLDEVCMRLGVETQRQCSDQAILCKASALFGLFSLVTFLAHHSLQRGKLPVRQATRYTKPAHTFAHSLAVVRKTLW